LSLDEADIALEQRGNDKNWNFGNVQAKADAVEQKAAQEPKKEAAITGFNIDAIKIKNSQLLFRKDGKDTLVKVDTAEASAGMTSTNVDLKGSVATIPVDLVVKAGTLTDLTAKKPVPVDLTAKTGGATLTFKGKADQANEKTAINGDFSLSGSDMVKLGTVLNAGLPAISRYEIAGNVASTQNGYAVKIPTLNLGNSKGQADLDYVDGVRDKLSGKIIFSVLDTADFGGKSSAPAAKTDGEPQQQQAAAPAGDGRSIPDVALPVGLTKGNMDMNLSVAVNKLLNQGKEIGKVNLALNSGPGRAAIQPITLTMNTGTINAGIDMQGNSTRLKASSDNLNYGELLKQNNVTDYVQANGKLMVDVVGGGSTLRQVLGSSAGAIEVIGNKGTINTKAFNDLGAGLLKLMVPGARDGEMLVMNCAVMRFKGSKGV
jgi:hypothetical protein